MFSENFVITPTPEEWESIKEGVSTGRVKTATDAEWARFVLRSLINNPETVLNNDACLEGLTFALKCVEEKMKA